MKHLFIDGKFRSVEQDNISTMMQAFNYGTAAFEGLKAFYRKNQKNWFLFRPEKHYERLLRGTSFLDIDLRMSQDEFLEIIKKLIIRNDVKTDVYIRPLIFRNAKGVGLTKPSKYGVSIFLQEAPRKRMRKLKCCFVRQRRPVDGSYSIKLTGNYLLSFLAYKEAVKRGYDEALLMSSNGFVSEATVMNLFFAKNDKLSTPSLSCGVLDGITRKSLIQLAREQLHIKVFEGKYRQNSLVEADEVFFTGTGSGINPVEQLEHKTFKNIGPESITYQLRNLYYMITSGTTDKYQEWLIPVK
jgi:branched-chain amino acid aminotransferase